MPGSSAEQITRLWNQCRTLGRRCCVNVNCTARRFCCKLPTHEAWATAWSTVPATRSAWSAHKSLVCVNTKQPPWDRSKTMSGEHHVNGGEGSRVRGALTSSTLACYFGSQGIVQQRGREQPQKGARRKKMMTRLGTSRDNSQKSANSQPLVVHNTHHATPSTPRLSPSLAHRKPRPYAPRNKATESSLPSLFKRLSMTVFQLGAEPNKKCRLGATTSSTTIPCN